MRYDTAVAQVPSPYHLALVEGLSSLIVFMGLLVVVSTTEMLSLLSSMKGIYFLSGVPAEIITLLWLITFPLFTTKSTTLGFLEFFKYLLRCNR